MVRLLQLFSATAGIAAAADSSSLLQHTSARDESVGNRILTAVAKGRGDTICVDAAVGDIAPVPGSFTAMMSQQAVEVAAGTTAEETGSFCVAKATVLLLQRTNSLHTAADIEFALSTKKSPTTTTTTTVASPNAANFQTFDFAGDPQKKVMVDECPDKSSTLTQTMEVTVSKKSVKSADPADQAQVCACRKFLDDGVSLRRGLTDYEYQPRVQLGTYPGYSGDLKVTGKVSAFFDPRSGTVQLQYKLEGVEDACKSPPEGVSNACGIHIHEGKTCDDHNAVGGHYYNKASNPDDPWSHIGYISQNGSATSKNGRAIEALSPPISIGQGSYIEGRAMVVHDSTGARVACAVLPVPIIPDFERECKKANTFQTRASLAKMMNDPTQVASYPQEKIIPSLVGRGSPSLVADLEGWEHCSKAWIIEGACAKRVDEQM